MSEQENRIKPIIIIPPKEVSPEDIKRLRENGMCVIVAKNPNSVKFLDNIPSAASRTKIENAAIALSRKILKPGFISSSTTRSEFTSMFVDMLVGGTPLDPNPSKEEREKQIFDIAKDDEIRTIAREEARAEREAKRKALVNVNSSCPKP